MRGRSVVLVACGACGFRAPIVGGDALPPGDALDAAPDVPSDVAGLTCEQKWLAHAIRFNPPVRIAELDTPGYERDPFLAPDELTIMFSTDRTGGVGGTDVWLAKRSTIGGTFGSPTVMPDVNSSGGEGKLSMTSNALSVAVASDRGGGQGGVDVWLGTRASPSGSFTMSQTHVGAINTGSNEFDPLLSLDGLRLYFAPVVSNVQQLAVSSRTSASGDFGAPTPLGSLNSGTGEADPALALADRLIVFSSNRTGNGDIYYATRATPTDPFGAPAPVPDVNTGSGDGDPWVSPDGCRLYFASYIGGDPDLFVATAMP